MPVIRSWDSLTDTNERKRFIFKVYSVLCVELLLTLAVVLIFAFVESAREFALKNWWLTIVFGLMFLFFALMMNCFPATERSNQLTLGLVIIATFIGSMLAGLVTGLCDPLAVILAIGTTALIVCVMTVIAANCTCDITRWWLFLLIAALALLCFGIIAEIVFIFLDLPILTIVYCGLAVLVFSLYLAFDTQMILGGQRYDLSTLDYVNGALHLYVDILTIFLDLLILFDTVR